MTADKTLPSPAEVNEEARALFAPWVQDLGIIVETMQAGRVIARVPKSAHLNRIGGTLSGQAMMAVADTVMVHAVRAALQVDADIATIQQSTSFFRAVMDADLICDVRLSKQGRAMMFGDCVMYPDGAPDKPAAQATIVYAVIPRR